MMVKRGDAVRSTSCAYRLRLDTDGLASANESVPFFVHGVVLDVRSDFGLRPGDSRRLDAYVMQQDGRCGWVYVDLLRVTVSS